MPAAGAGTWRDRLVWDERALDPEGNPSERSAAAWTPSASTASSSGSPTTSLIEVRLDTGKRNQIRIQARLRGHTLVGEQRYIYGPGELRPIAFPRHALHAHRLAFRHPADGRPLRFEAPIPADLTGLLERLRRASGSAHNRPAIKPIAP